jgi:dihydrofolate reductase
VRGLERAKHRVGQIALHGAEIHGLPGPGGEGRDDRLGVVPGPVEPPVHGALHPAPQRVEQRGHHERGGRHRDRGVASLGKAGRHIMGRVTYEQMAGHWPDATGDYAACMNTLPKVVFSRTLPAASWTGSRIARGDLAGEIAALKDEPGGDIMAHGGAAFAQALSRLGLIDEYRLVILPVALGGGLPLFKDLGQPLRLDLAGAATFPDGTAIHVYRPRTATLTS